MLNEYHEQLESDFDERGWDLLAVWRGELSLRKLWVRIRNLPRSSAFLRAIDPHGTRWTATDYLLAQMIDTLHWANGSKYHVPRPGSAEEAAAIERPKREAATRARMRAKFDERQRRNAERGTG